MAKKKKASRMASFKAAWARFKEHHFVRRGLEITWFAIKKTAHFLKEVGLKIWGFIMRNFKKNFLDQKGRIDTGRVGQILGLVLMVLLVQYIMGHALKNNLDTIDMGKILSIGGPSGLLMTLYRLKDFAGTSGPGDDQGLPGGG